MEKFVKIALLMLSLLLLLMPLACGDSAEESTAANLGQISLAHVNTILDMSESLPSRFERVDAASVGMSSQDLELGYSSETVVFLSENPYQLISAYYMIAPNWAEQQAADALLKDEEKIKELVALGLNQGFSEAGLENIDVTGEIEYPDIGDLSILGIGIINISGTYVGFDIVIVKVGKVYVSINSVYFSEDNVSLVPVAQDIVERINMYSQ